MNEIQKLINLLFLAAIVFVLANQFLPHEDAIKYASENGLRNVTERTDKIIAALPLKERCRIEFPDLVVFFYRDGESVSEREKLYDSCVPYLEKTKEVPSIPSHYKIP